MVRILTDSAADFSREEADRRELLLLPLSIIFDDCVYQQEDDKDFRKFYELLKQHAQIPSTSQATPESYLEQFRKAKDAGDEMVIVTLSSGLSSTHESALSARKALDYEGIYVVDSLSAVMGQRILVEYALRLRDEGQGAKQIYEALLKVNQRVRIYGMLDTLDNLRKGGRIPKSAAVIGTLLNIKPIIIVKDGVIGMIGKARGSQAGIKMLLERIDASPGMDLTFPVYFGNADAPEQGRKFRDEVVERYGLAEGPMFRVGGVVGAHVGAGTIAVAFVERTQS